MRTIEKKIQEKFRLRFVEKTDFWKSYFRKVASARMIPILSQMESSTFKKSQTYLL